MEGPCRLRASSRRAPFTANACSRSGFVRAAWPASLPSEGPPWSVSTLPSTSRSNAAVEARRHGVEDQQPPVRSRRRQAGIPVAGERFHVVFTKSALVVVNDRTVYLQSIRALLKPGGLFGSRSRTAGVVGWPPFFVDSAIRLGILRRSTTSPMKRSARARVAVHALEVRHRRLPPVWLFVGRVDDGVAT